MTYPCRLFVIGFYNDKGEPMGQPQLISAMTDKDALAILRARAPAEAAQWEVYSAALTRRGSGVVADLSVLAMPDAPTEPDARAMAERIHQSGQAAQ